MVYWDEQGNTVEISKADQLWLDDGYFKTQQAHLPPDAPRAALSYRVSTKGQVDHNDIPMQKIKCRKFAQQQGWRVVMEKAEKGISGSKVSASKRDVIQELRQEAGNGSFDILLVYMFDRLGRIESETPFVLEWFVQHGIQMWSVHEGQQRIESHGDKLMNYIRFWQAAGESEKTSIRTRDRIRQIVSSGHFAGGFVPYGYRAVDKGRVNKRDQPVKDLEIDPEEAAWVREVFEKVANEGASGYAMARMLNDRGLCTRQGARFQSVNIRRMIRHEGYTGYLITKAARSEFIQELQIVDEKLFARANEVIDCRSKKLAQEKNIAAKTNNPTLLAGIVVCAHCGAKMSAFLHQRPAVLPAWISCPLPAAFSGSPLRGHRRVSHADGHAVFKVQQAKRKQKSRHRTNQPCLRFFWKVMLVGYVTAERICKNMLYSIVGIGYHKNRAVST